jgi:hypothetical protein
MQRFESLLLAPAIILGTPAEAGLNQKNWCFCHSGLNPESIVFSKCYATGCRIKSGTTGTN